MFITALENFNIKRRVDTALRHNSEIILVSLLSEGKLF